MSPANSSALSSPVSTGVPTPFVVPPALEGSPMLRAGGALVLNNFPDPHTLEALRQEAYGQLPSAISQVSFEDDGEEGRGGTPQRQLLTSGAGAMQDAFYSAPWLAQYLSAQCQLPIVPSGNRGSYSYYARPGDFLGLHRDVETCDMALLTCLEDNPQPGCQGGNLVVYPTRRYEPLSNIRRSPQAGALAVPLQPGQTAALLGGVVPHQVLPVAPGQRRIMSVLCFRILI